MRAPTTFTPSSWAAPRLVSTLSEAGRGQSPPGAAAELLVSHVGADGDGVAVLGAARDYIAFTLPGEIVRIQAGAPAIVRASRDRITPPCLHFGTCGGCALQHWADAPYAAWKSGQVEAALRRAGCEAAGFEGKLAPPSRTLPLERRRMDVAVRRGSDGVVIGLNAARSASVVDLRTCHVLHPTLFALLGPLRDLLARLACFRREGSAIANLLDAGPDLLLRLDGTPGLADRRRLIAFGEGHGLCRISCAPISCARGDGDPEPIAEWRPPTIGWGGVEVRPPPGAFLQASRAGEAAITGAVLAGLPASMARKAWIAELFAGCGTLTFPMARVARIAAFEGNAASVAALREAANGAELSGRVTVQPRDLGRRPLLAAELAGCAAVVLDPPHAGAAAQMAGIAGAKVPRVIHVGCNPAALARDAAALHGAGYRLLAATAIDQFLWSARVESVCVFAR